MTNNADSTLHDVMHMSASANTNEAEPLKNENAFGGIVDRDGPRNSVLLPLSADFWKRVTLYSRNDPCRKSSGVRQCDNVTLHVSPDASKKAGNSVMFTSGIVSKLSDARTWRDV
ncbi:unnamed protein product [Chondrus crispus]|uniref:Uncharacterized protein n=1 Tax=Chondrus crispus TaxID=2769 RepID=R7Q766_CHOCR|nr:unnamed protein product [Chondrus crispus]CDF33864.1 unnamed protein product [Chondrus crispus]|eukprot:XP_005713683.1 unnamed protein product [Chondrus crispus]